MFQIFNSGENKTFFSFMDGLKPWAKDNCDVEESKNLTKP